MSEYYFDDETEAVGIQRSIGGPGEIEIMGFFTADDIMKGQNALELVKALGAALDGEARTGDHLYLMTLLKRVKEFSL